MRKVLLLNKGWSDNLGDRAIKLCITHLLQEQDCNVTFRDLTSKSLENYKCEYENVGKSKWERFVKVASILPIEIRWTIKNLWSVINHVRRNDFIVIGGGQLILSNSYFPWSIFVWVLISKLLRRKLYFYGVGVGMDFPNYHQTLYKYALKNINQIVLRDPKSVKYLKEYFNIDGKITHDVVFCISDLTKPEVKKSNKVLVGIIDYEVYLHYNPNSNKDRNAYHQYWLDLIVSYDLIGKDIELFSTTSKDLEESKQFQVFLSEKGIIASLIQITDLDGLLEAVFNASCVFSGRMHALIIAISYECPRIIPFNVSHKINEFERNYLTMIDLQGIKKQIRKDIEKLVECMS